MFICVHITMVSQHDTCHNLLLSTYGSYMYLKIFLNSDDVELYTKYKNAVDKHNNNIINNVNEINSGFDLFTPCDKFINTFCGADLIDYNVICKATLVHPTFTSNTGFYIYPRSSIIKTKFRLANSVGIIDAGYRGNLIGAFDTVRVAKMLFSPDDQSNPEQYYYDCYMHRFDRYIQICAPGLLPILVEMVDKKELLGEQTTRGSGGFGSTGV